LFVIQIFAIDNLDLNIFIGDFFTFAFDVFASLGGELREKVIKTLVAIIVPVKLVVKTQQEIQLVEYLDILLFAE